MSGGVLVDLVIHDFDFLRWTLGEVERVFARGVLGHEFNRLDYALATLRFAGGAIAHIEGHWGYPGPFNYSIELAGSRAHRRGRQHGAGTGRPGRWGRRAEPRMSRSARDPYQAELEHFVRCVDDRGGTVRGRVRRLRGAQDLARRNRVGQDGETRDAGRADEPQGRHPELRPRPRPAVRGGARRARTPPISSGWRTTTLPGAAGGRSLRRRLLRGPRRIVRAVEAVVVCSENR